MKQKYQLSLHCVEENLPEVSNHLRQSVQSSGLLDKVDISSSGIRFVNHGQNPVEDADSRTYIRIRAPTGEEIFQTFEVLLRTSHRNFKNYVQGAIRTIQRYSELVA